MPNGSLDRHLFSDGDNKPLSWNLRYKIISEVASALHYLHNEFDQRVVHLDIKPNNIMLDSKFNARLGDLGLSQALHKEKGSYKAAEVPVAGTLGYLDPEYATTGKATDLCDVFSFGVVLLAVVCGEKAVNVNLCGWKFLSERVWDMYREGQLLEVVDKRLGEDYVVEDQRILLLGLACSHPISSERPKTQEIVQILSGSMAVPQVPPFKPPFSWPYGPAEEEDIISLSDGVEYNSYDESGVWRLWPLTQNRRHIVIEDHDRFMAEKGSLGLSLSSVLKSMDRIVNWCCSYEKVMLFTLTWHKHLLRLLGWCHKHGKLLLVYDYMPNGSLDKHLFGAANRNTLSWTLRYKIISEVASALHYLHNGPWTQNGKFLVDWVCALHRKGRLLEAVDSRLGEDYIVEEAQRVLLLGLACSHPIASERPKTQEIVQILSGSAVVPHVLLLNPTFSQALLSMQQRDVSLPTITDTTSSTTSHNGSGSTPLAINPETHEIQETVQILSGTVAVPLVLPFKPAFVWASGPMGEGDITQTTITNTASCMTSHYGSVYKNFKSLDKHLFNSNANSTPLSWNIHYKIIFRVSSALHYLRNEYQKRVIHHDLKASNIMLDAEFNAMLGDFGLARALGHEKTSYAEVEVIPGTRGYNAPELWQTGKTTAQSDVYAFGIVLLEVVYGRRPRTQI
ncbi:hypothetical protein Vadar_028496 [Vaccinium darrowii]|uniref:Uncharacterized protein n=1 Tax=Vaccinium darrowii TaxID=229202 RepID=A0ACB7Y999_9ERIC|nr:hypothetical protein Vadar_028496 [Vaccinium darrowii]